jgi:hypothetical protein
MVRLDFKRCSYDFIMYLSDLHSDRHTRHGKIILNGIGKRYLKDQPDIPFVVKTQGLKAS